jgi:hypothetical protein
MSLQHNNSLMFNLAIEVIKSSLTTNFPKSFDYMVLVKMTLEN